MSATMCYAGESLFSLLCLAEVGAGFLWGHVRKDPMTCLARGFLFLAFLPLALILGGTVHGLPYLWAELSSLLPLSGEEGGFALILPPAFVPPDRRDANTFPLHEGNPGEKREWSNQGWETGAPGDTESIPAERFPALSLLSLDSSTAGPVLSTLDTHTPECALLPLYAPIEVLPMTSPVLASECGLSDPGMITRDDRPSTIPSEVDPLHVWEDEGGFVPAPQEEENFTVAACPPLSEPVADVLTPDEGKALSTPTVCIRPSVTLYLGKVRVGGAYAGKVDWKGEWDGTLPLPDGHVLGRQEGRRKVLVDPREIVG